jgi:2,6-dihydroxypyridine 3-monooxygenase
MILYNNKKSIAERVLPTVFGQLVVQTNEPFIQTIYDLSVPRMAFGRVCILGDAAFVPRPHTAAGLSKAATNAVALANSIANSSNVDVVEALRISCSFIPKPFTILCNLNR